MNADGVDDLTLAQRVVAGDSVALQAMYARYAEPLYAFVYHHLDGVQVDAEEVWQDALLAALQSLATYRGQSSLFTWLCGIARHKVVDHRRRRAGRHVEPLSAVPPARLATLLDEGPLPEDVLLQRATRLRVVEALAALPADYRTALVARYADGQSVDEIARRLGKTYKACESLLARARAAFRGVLLDLDEEEGNQWTTKDSTGKITSRG